MFDPKNIDKKNENSQIKTNISINNIINLSIDNKMIPEMMT